MKKLIYIVMISVLAVACKDNEKEGDTNAEQTENAQKTTTNETAKPNYSKSMNSLFEAHGGMNTWNTMNNLCFEVRTPNGMETHTVSLPDRKVKIETKDWSMGYDGSNVWLLENEPNSYEGNPMFYHNLMYYFYAMPYVLGDNGITYKDDKQAQLDGKTYDVVNVAFNKGIGNTPNDQYKLFIDPETHKMVWLAYTVTFNTDTTNNDWKFIKYDKWTEVNGLLMPEKITWYNVENNQPKGEKSDIVFKNITMTETRLDNSVFKKPEGASVVK